MIGYVASMHLKTKVALLVVMVMAFMPAAGNAYACDGSHSGVAAASYTMVRHHHRGLLRAAATYLGLTKAELKAKLAAGQSLAQVASATPGKSSTGLVDYLTGLVKTRLDRWVAAGKLTSAQESALLMRVQHALTRLMNARR